jgi:hypothetical protein
MARFSKRSHSIHLNRYVTHVNVAHSPSCLEISSEHLSVKGTTPEISGLGKASTSMTSVLLKHRGWSTMYILHACYLITNIQLPSHELAQLQVVS